jgi:hypothetical protein
MDKSLQGKNKWTKRWSLGDNHRLTNPSANPMPAVRAHAFKAENLALAYMSKEIS